MLSSITLKNHLCKTKAVVHILSESFTKVIKDWGSPAAPERTIWKKSSNIKHHQLFVADDWSITLCPVPESNERVPLHDYVKHTAFWHRKKNILDMLADEVGVDIDRIVSGESRLYLVEGMTYSADEDSGLGKGHIHCTPRFNLTDHPKHDFVEVDVEVMERNGTTSRGKQPAQVVAFLQVIVPNDVANNRAFSSRYFAFLQYLELETVSPQLAKAPKKVPVIQPHESIFNRYKWEQTNYNDRHSQLSFQVNIVEHTSILQLAWVVPDFRSIEVNSSLRENYISSPKTADRYWYVPRSFTDRSGWNIEFEAQARWRANTYDPDDGDQGEEAALREHLLDELERNQAANRTNATLRRFDVGDVFGTDDEEDEREDDSS
jgi:hypothetical protein